MISGKLNCFCAVAHQREPNFQVRPTSVFAGLHTGMMLFAMALGPAYWYESNPSRAKLSKG
ncbi:hypothetical protein IG631_07789 [Alternaria alternata]|nr:hypothetical protein IG631_07789 [Alternaria alternata]